MGAATRYGDTCSGHSPYSPRPCISGSPDVFINGKSAHRKGDSWAPHRHSGVLAAGSPNVFVNGRPLGRKADPVSCGSIVASGSPNVFANG